MAEEKTPAPLDTEEVLGRLKISARIDGSYLDDQLRFMLRAAQRQIELKTGRSAAELCNMPGAEPGVWPEDIIHAAILYVRGTLDEGVIINGAGRENPFGVSSLLAPYRRLTRRRDGEPQT